MKTILLMFDSLNREMLNPYGCTWTKTPNFQRLAQRSVCFTNSYAGSLPCMPARRELHTGRYNFLHRSWGPLEPWDDSMPELLKNNDILSHLVSDHTHYWEDGGATYHTRYSSWDFIRGQEGDPWKVLPELIRKDGKPQNKDGEYFPITGKMHCQDAVNRRFCNTEETMPIARTFESGLEFIQNNHEQDRWFLQLESFDPHEPFHSTQNYKALYPHAYEGPSYDWPPYHQVTEAPETANHLKLEYASLLSMCDAYLGKLLDLMDQYALWNDTMLIVNTDHGYLLGEHGWWSKGCMPWYDELVHTPLFIHDPRFHHDGELRDQIVQTIDIPATILEFFGIKLPDDMQGKPLCTVINDNKANRDYALFGVHGGHVNVFDGQYVYMKAPMTQDNQPLYEYTLMPTHMRNRFGIGELRTAILTEPFGFTKDCPLLKIEKVSGISQSGFSDLLMGGGDRQAARYIDNNSLTNAANFGDKLFDLKADPKQEYELDDAAIELRMADILINAMKENDAPPEQFLRIGFPANSHITMADIKKNRNAARISILPEILPDYRWNRSAINVYRALMKFIPAERRDAVAVTMATELEHRASDYNIDYNLMLSLIPLVICQEYCDMVYYFVSLAGRVS